MVYLLLSTQSCRPRAANGSRGRARKPGSTTPCAVPREGRASKDARSKEARQEVAPTGISAQEHLKRGTPAQGLLRRDFYVGLAGYAGFGAAGAAFFLSASRRSRS